MQVDHSICKLLKICSSEGLFTEISIFAHVLRNYCETTHSAGTNHSHIGLVIFNDLFWSWCQISEVEEVHSIPDFTLKELW